METPEQLFASIKKHFEYKISKVRLEISNMFSLKHLWRVYNGKCETGEQILDDPNPVKTGSNRKKNHG